MLNELYTVDTPEQIELAYDVAGPGSRSVAALVDHIIVAVLVFLAVLGTFFLIDVFGIDSAIIAGVIAFFGSYFTLCIYYIAFETWWNGQTPGKRLFDLRMVRDDGRPISFGASAIRNLLRIVDFLPGAYGIGFMTMFFDKRSRRLGDMAAGCMAIKQRGALTLDTLVQQSAAQQSLPPASQITITNLHVLRPVDMQLVDAFVQRRAMLTPEARTRLAQQVLAQVQTRLGYTVTENPETFLDQLAAQYRALQQRA